MTRLGPHVNTVHRADIAADYIRRVQPDAVKMLSTGIDGRVVVAAQEVGALIIGRLYWDDQKLGAEYGRFIARLIEWCGRHPYIGWVEGANEFAQSPGELERYAVHEIDRMKALDAIGRKAVIGNFSTGTPDMAHWSRFKPALEYAAAHGHALGLHCYSGPVMQWMAGNNQWNGGAYTLNDPCEGPAVEGWLTLRYRKLQKLLNGWGIGHLKLAFTETGIDDVQPRPGPQGKGWKSYVNTEYGNMPPFGDYASQLAWYGRRLTEDPNVIAWVDFGFSQAGDWSTFDLSDSTVMRERVIAEMLKLPRRHTGQPTPPPTTPEPPMPANPPTIPKPAASHSSRAGQRCRYVVVHSTDSPAGATPTGTADYLQSNDRQVSIHELVNPNATYVMVPDERAAHHAGAASSTLPDGTSGSAVNLATWGLEIYQVHGRPCDPVLVERAAVRVADACRRLGIVWGRVVAHREIDPTRRSDPVGVDMDAFRRRVAELLGAAPEAPAPPAIDAKRLWIEADGNQTIHLNPGAGLQRAILAEGLVPTSDEWDHSPRYVAQRAEALAGGPAEVFVYDRETGKVSRHGRPR